MSTPASQAMHAADSPLAAGVQGVRAQARRKSAIRDLLWLYSGRLLILLGFAGLWWVAVQLKWMDKFFVSSPDAVVRFLFSSFTKEIVPNARNTLLATVIAFALSGVAGVLAGLILFELPKMKRMVDPFLTALNSMPRIALAPLFILWFGIELTSKVALAFSLGFFIVLLSTYAGIRNVDPVLMRLSRSLGCTPWQQFTKIMLPWAVPSVFAGLKLALIYSFLGVVTSEMLASKVGLGQLIMYYSGILRMDAVLGILLVMAVCAVVLTLVGDWVEAALLGSWAESSSAHA